MVKPSAPGRLAALADLRAFAIAHGLAAALAHVADAEPLRTRSRHLVDATRWGA